MFSEWQETTIGQQVTLQRGIDITKAQQRAGNVPVVSSGGISSYHDTAHAKGPGVVLGRKGTLGTVFFIPEDYWPHDTSLWVRDFHGNDPRFVYYFFRSIASDLLSLDVGTSNPTLNRNHVHPIKVLWPSPDEQHAIAHVLGALDDKIDLNRQMNRTLEAMAQTLFKSWFLDFDPVTAKAAGRKPYGMNEETGALFPNAFEDSELGDIPKGWRVEKIDDCVVRHSVGKKYDQFTVSDKGKVPVLDQGRSGIIGFHDDEPGVVASLENPIIVFANHTCYMRLITFPFSAIQNVLPFTGRDLNIFWLFYATNGIQEFLEYKGHWPDFVIKKIVVPPKPLDERFGDRVKSWVALINHNEEQSQTLASLRDALLPKLLSGEICVRQAEKLVAEAV